MKTKFSTKSASYLFILFAALTMSITSCSKEEDAKLKEEDTELEDEKAGSGAFSFKAGGVLKELGEGNAKPTCRLVKLQNEYTLTIAAISADGTKMINIEINDTKPFTTKEYTGQVYGANTNKDFILGSYISYSDGVNLTYSSFGLVNSDVIVKITKLSESSMSGTFSGTLTGRHGQGDMNVTNGQFTGRVISNYKF